MNKKRSWFRYKMKHLIETDRICLVFYQMPKRLQFGIITDWSESPFIFDISILFWSISIGICSNEHIRINKEYDARIK